MPLSFISVLERKTQCLYGHLRNHPQTNGDQLLISDPGIKDGKFVSYDTKTNNIHYS